MGESGWGTGERIGGDGQNMVPHKTRCACGAWEGRGGRSGGQRPAGVCFFFGPGERKEKGTGREELGGGDELLCLVCVLVCVV